LEGLDLKYSEWKEYRLSELMDIIGGGTPKTSIAEYWNGDIPWLSVKDFVGDNRYVYITEKSITEEGLKNSSTKLLKKGSIIISARGTVGEIAQLGRDMAFNQSCYGLVANQKTTNDFLYYLLKNTIKYLKKETHGSVFDTITRDTFKNIKVKIPNLKVQHLITKMLSSIDEKIELNNQMNKNLEEIAQSIFKHWFVDFEFPNENGEPYKSSGGKFVESELGMIPKEWRLLKIGDFITVTDGTHDSPKKQESGYPLITSKHIKNNTLLINEANLIKKEDYEKINIRSKVDSRDILISMIGTVGVLYYVLEENINFAIKNIGLFKTSEKLDYANYIYLYLDSKNIRKYLMQRLAGSTQQYISLGELRNLPVVIPPSKVIQQFNKIVEPIFITIKTNKEQIQTLANLRDILLPKLMSGEIRIPEAEEAVESCLQKNN
jgi:type I restriction enzyme, S subunit